MAVPCHLLKVCGNIVFAAQGSDIHSFSSELEYISTWRYPVKQEAESTTPAAEIQESPAPEEPPRSAGKKAAQYDNPANERPFVQGLYATADGRHVVAITGSDKTIWVFEHDAFTADNRTILSANKFGDVHALPLLPSPTTSTSATTSSSPNPTAGLPLSRSATPSTPTATAFKPQANEFTVHTKRNLKALENQKRSLSRKASQDQQQQQQQAPPPFEYALLLGHVSMLTAICVGTATVAVPAAAQASEPSTGTGNGTGNGAEAASAPARTTVRREYIITADRDEHIRVSRGMPQAHVIEGFCLGHEEFVSQLCMAPGGREELLISGGGDDDLFVWDWVNGRLLGRAGVLEHVKRVAGGDVDKVAVTRVFGCGWQGTTAVFVVVERVPALFQYELLDDNKLRHHETIPLRGNPLDVDIIESPSGGQRLLVAMDPSASVSIEEGSSSLVVLDKQETGWKQTNVENLPACEDANISADELQKILYSTESLRKLTDFD
ncbi:21064eb3-aa97-4643-8e48-66c5c0249ce7 [Thermothielavioides terrestris]|uniref:21064eb3-aa97-4643-8e48-66c5c0249ce7 n=1 Tax=Thermothielavioides terrestris TaxID=2587410 RepID=A0A3S4AIZ0_9PEZI|nr:21064eb3-aa97-4643-8e48-66c5c0249ce7 [Thermothielavioides terrestris]